MVNCVRLLPYALIAADRAASVCASDRPTLTQSQANAFYCRLLDFCGCIWLCYIGEWLVYCVARTFIPVRTGTRTHAQTQSQWMLRRCVCISNVANVCMVGSCACVCVWAAMVSVLLYVHFTLLGCIYICFLLCDFLCASHLLLFDFSFFFNFGSFSPSLSLSLCVFFPLFVFAVNRAVHMRVYVQCARSWSRVAVVIRRLVVVAVSVVVHRSPIELKNYRNI